MKISAINQSTYGNNSQVSFTAQKTISPNEKRPQIDKKTIKIAGLALGAITAAGIAIYSGKKVKFMQSIPEILDEFAVSQKEANKKVKMMQKVLKQITQKYEDLSQAIEFKCPDFKGKPVKGYRFQDGTEKLIDAFSTHIRVAKTETGEHMSILLSDTQEMINRFFPQDNTIVRQSYKHIFHPENNFSIFGETLQDGTSRSVYLTPKGKVKAVKRDLGEKGRYIIHRYKNDIFQVEKAKSVVTHNPRAKKTECKEFQSFAEGIQVAIFSDKSQIKITPKNIQQISPEGKVLKTLKQTGKDTQTVLAKFNLQPIPVLEEIDDKPLHVIAAL